MSSTCENSNNRHYHITVQNQSDSDLDICSRAIIPFENLCALTPIAVVEKNSTFEWQPFNFSIERELREGGVLELFFVNNHQPQGFYDCDSIFIKNDILRHYRLTLEDLRRMNFTITYP